MQPSEKISTFSLNGRPSNISGGWYVSGFTPDECGTVQCRSRLHPRHSKIAETKDVFNRVKNNIATLYITMNYI